VLVPRITSRSAKARPRGRSLSDNFDCSGEIKCIFSFQAISWIPFSAAGTIQTNSIVLSPALSLALHRSPFLRIFSNLRLLPLHRCFHGVASFTALSLGCRVLPTAVPAGGGSFDRARDQRRLKARAMCSVRNEASSEWRANLRMRFIKRKSLQTGPKSRCREVRNLII
jgi:hypothetical protein